MYFNVFKQGTVLQFGAGVMVKKYNEESLWQLNTVVLKEASLKICKCRLFLTIVLDAYVQIHLSLMCRLYNQWAWYTQILIYLCLTLNTLVPAAVKQSSLMGEHRL